MVVSVDTRNPRSVKALAIVADSGQWLKLRTAQGANVRPVEGVAEDTPLSHHGAHGDPDHRVWQRCQEASMLTLTLPRASTQLVGFAA